MIKPGMLCIVVRDYLGIHIGKIGVVSHQEPTRPTWDSGIYWRLEPDLVDPDGYAVAFHNDDLRPIQNPGEQENDEMVLLCGNPNETLEDVWEATLKTQEMYR